MERRVWVRRGGEPIYPNLMVMLVGNPGSGKSRAINPLRRILHGAKISEDNQIKFAPDDFTKASLVDAMEKAGRFVEEERWSALYIAAHELSVLQPFDAGQMMGVINDFYDCQKPKYEETKRTGNKTISIENPTVNVLAGVQPGYLAANLDEQAWRQGFLARFIMIYGEPIKAPRFFYQRENPRVHNQLLFDLIEDLKKMRELFGELKFSEEAIELLEKLYGGGFKPIPTHPRLANYVTRRELFLLKLMTISSISNGPSGWIEHHDVDRAFTWLREAEASMPYVFSQMYGDSDSLSLEELHTFVEQRCKKTGGPISISEVYDYLSLRMKAREVENLIKLALQARKLVFIPPEIPGEGGMIRPGRRP